MQNHCWITVDFPVLYNSVARTEQQ